ncbi:TT1751-like protein [Dendrothele bispora CBS 962.96]|uniref:TT1751-like protein n=1 Tax=Dendrothele bispora (strain CBS 962.96) TaxID=1314807 RepID=A0A4S8MYT5_DENBC|nr:TT1751-like protein [Dendrothele bispora CBS 962.96]
MSKTITPFTAQLVTFDSDLPFAQVCERLESEVNKSASAGLFSAISSSKSKEELEEAVSKISGGNDFVYFLQIRHDGWLKLYNEQTPPAILYTIGNPVIAQTMLKHDLRGAYNIPPRVLVLGKLDGSGTNVIYHLPSSVIALNDNPELKEAALALDEKLDRLITKVTTK